ncbi:hypothetical protein NP233_g4188 [Leucocoprinus birnbaumii]|uniref:CAP-Gly domain-containing protein n=1 Tax=Leucocoprinus birnbaumii TaxID=56174 RepID=A0AAD5VVV0_9AGAR|nr:hypothetical protein NP233_g4188 [Leucocoprinus birnbaumii]
MDPPLGSIVTIAQGKGVVRFSGTIHTAAGKWIGVELYEPNGKNDGSIQNTVYFSCKKPYGIFVHQSKILDVHGMESDSRPTTRPQGHQRNNSQSLLRSSTLRPASNTGGGSVSSAASSPRAGSPAKLPPASSSNRLPQVQQRQATSSPTKRAPGGLNLQPRRSIALRQSPNSDVPPSPGPTSPAPPPSSFVKKSTVASTAPGVAAAQIRVKRTSSPLSLPPETADTAISPSTSPNVPAPIHTERPPSIQQPATRPQQDDTELQELRVRLRVLEAKRTDDARRIRELENQLEEAKNFVAVKPKLLLKLNQLQQDLISTKRELSDAQQLSQLAEGRVLDAQEQLEMAMLDKEMAEERAEGAEGEVEELKEKLAVLEVEIGVMKGEGGEGDGSVGGGGNGGETNVKGSLAYIQLEKQNERLKEALIKLRDLSQDTEHEQRKRIQEMEKDIETLDELQVQYDETLIKLSNAETEIEGLKLQLDDALHAEDLLVKLTERNLELGEKIEEMRITIEDLEALKELNDELEENHMETEKQLYDDIEKRDAEIREQMGRIVGLEDAYQDLEGTVGQFRELVLQLQTELDALRAQTQTAQNESATAASQAAAMISLNMKLQSSAAKNLARNIDLEIKKLEARESKELLAIVQPYLPQLYIQSDFDATHCYLFFLRLSYKMDLINTTIAQKHNLPDSLNQMNQPSSSTQTHPTTQGSGQPISEVLVGICEMRGRIAQLSTLCKRFARVLKCVDVETFLNVGGRIFPEVKGVEKRVDMHVELLRRDEFREMECVSDVAKIQAQFDHLAETYFDGFDFDLGERELGYAVSFDSDLDMFSASVALTKTCVVTVMEDQDVVLDLGGYDVETELLEPLQKLLDLCRSAKVLSKKLTKRLDDLIQDSAALKASIIPQLKALSNPVAELVNFGISLAQLIMNHTNDARSSKSSFQLTTVMGFVKNTATSTVAKDLKPTESPWDAVGDAISKLVEEGTKMMPLVLENENVIKINSTPPWILRISEIKAALEVNVEAERKVAKLNDEMQALMRSLKSKDQNIQEASVKIEWMERRMEAAKKQAEVIGNLEMELMDMKKQKRDYEEAMEHLQADLDVLEQDNVKLKALTAGQEKQASGAQQIETENIAIEGSWETSYLLEQIEALRGTVRFLRTENSYLKGQDLLREIESLPRLYVPAAAPPTPPLVPSGLSDTESDGDSDEDDPLGGGRRRVTLRTLTTETKMLYRDVIRFSSSPKVVDLSALSAKRNESSRRGWMPRSKTPAAQVLERKMQAERLGRRVQGLLERAIRNKARQGRIGICDLSEGKWVPEWRAEYGEPELGLLERVTIDATGSFIPHHSLHLHLPLRLPADGADDTLHCLEVDHWSYGQTRRSGTSKFFCGEPTSGGKRGGGHSRKRSSTEGKSGSEPYNAPLWPCEINGCGKQFVREADLRRHQRTTKVHANPNFVCGECGASFTRTDALKRHEKSKSHVARAPSFNSGVFIEDAAPTAASTSSRSRSSRSLSPGPSREKERERRERERRLGDRELPPPLSLSSRYYRPHSLTSIPSSLPQPAAPFSHQQTHSSSLNAILASPISTPRLHPANWASPYPGPTNGYAHSPPPPPPQVPSPPKPSNGHYVPQYRYPPRSPPRMVSQLLAPKHHPTPLSHEPQHRHGHEPSSSSSSSKLGLQDPRPREHLDTCRIPSDTRIDSSLKGNEAPSITALRSKETPSFTPSPSPAPTPKSQLLAPPIAATSSEETTLALATLTDDDSNSSDDDEPEENDDEVDELESTDSETEIPQPKTSPPLEAVTKEVLHGSGGHITATSTTIIRDIDIEACIDPDATGITEEEVKAALDDVRKQEELEQEQALVEHQVKAQNTMAVVDGLGIGIRARGTDVDRAEDDDGRSPFLSEMVLSSSAVNGRHGRGRNLDRRASPGGGRRVLRDSRSPPLLLEDPRDDVHLDEEFPHHHHPRHHSTRQQNHDELEDEIPGSRMEGGSSSDVDMKVGYDIDDSDVDNVGDVFEKGVAGIMGANRLTKNGTNAMDVDEDDGINDSGPESGSLPVHDRPGRDHNRHRRHIGYSNGGSGGGSGAFTSPSDSLDRSVSRSPFEQQPQYRHERLPHPHVLARSSQHTAQQHQQQQLHPISYALGLGADSNLFTSGVYGSSNDAFMKPKKRQLLPFAFVLGEEFRSRVTFVLPPPPLHAIPFIPPPRIHDTRIQCTASHRKPTHYTAFLIPPETTSFDLPSSPKAYG